MEEAADFASEERTEGEEADNNGRWVGAWAEVKSRNMDRRLVLQVVVVEDACDPMVDEDMLGPLGLLHDTLLGAPFVAEQHGAGMLETGLSFLSVRASTREVYEAARYQTCRLGPALH